MNKKLLKEIYFNIILKKVYYKFFFFIEKPLFLNLKINLNIKDNLYLYFYFLEMVFFKKPRIEKGKMSYNKIGQKTFSSTILLNIYDLFYILNFFKTIFISSKGIKSKNNNLISLNSKYIILNNILNSSMFNLYKDSLISILNVVPSFIFIRNSNKFLNYFLFRLLGLIS